MEQDEIDELKKSLKERIFWERDYKALCDGNGKKLDAIPIDLPELISSSLHPELENERYLVVLRGRHVPITAKEIESIFQISGDVRFNLWSEVYAHIIAAQHGPSSANAYLLGKHTLTDVTSYVFYPVQYFKIIDRQSFPKSSVESP